MAQLARMSATVFSSRGACQDARSRPYPPMVFWQGLMQKHAAMTPRNSPSAEADANHRLKAIGLMALATLCFAVLDSTGKYLIVKEGVPVAQVTWVRFVGHVVFSAVALWPFAFKPT